MENKVSNLIDQNFPTSESVDRMAQTAHAAIDRVAEQARPAVDKARAAATHAAAAMESKASQIGEMEAQWMDSCRAHVRQHPLSSMAIAVAAGMLIARLAR
ncbi:MAG TPA: hypothetical protein VE029_09655 [Rhizobacter sp.]|nr:hypothetical protein [Rhizobacter sp.]